MQGCGLPGRPAGRHPTQERQAETASDATPYGPRHLLGRAVWSADAVRDELYAYVTEHLGDPGGVVVVDETG